MQHRPIPEEIIHACKQITASGLFPEEFDITDFDKQVEFLREEKHQLLEGLTIEFVAQQLIEHIALNEDFKILDVVTLITKSKLSEDTNQYCSFIWARDNNNIDDLLKVFQNMADGCHQTTFICRELDFKFYVTKPNSTQWKPLQYFLRSKRNLCLKDIKFPIVHNDSKIIARQESSIRGKLKQAFQNNFIKDVILPRVFKNHIIQPFFRSAWDLDRLFRYKNNLWEFELKHKYPIQNYEYFSNKGNPDHPLSLSFGINEGQAQLVQMLAKQGMNTLHLILVKPRWTDTIDPGYIFLDEDAKEKTLIIGTVLDEKKISSILLGLKKKSPPKTSYSGTADTIYYRIPRNFFQVIGFYSEGRQTLSPRINSLLDGTLDHPLTTKKLLDNCIERNERI